MKLFNRDSGGRFSTLTKRMEPTAKKMGVMFAVYAILFTGAYVGYTHSTVIVNQVEAETVQKVEQDPPVMQRIAKCESKNSQVGKSGQLQINVNTNGTVDIGRYEINSVWFAQATKLGLDLSTEQGNHDMAMWIYQNKGTGAWASSANCWNK